MAERLSGVTAAKATRSAANFMGPKDHSTSASAPAKSSPSRITIPRPMTAAVRALSCAPRGYERRTRRSARGRRPRRFTRKDTRGRSTFSADAQSGAMRDLVRPPSCELSPAGSLRMTDGIQGRSSDNPTWRAMQSWGTLQRRQRPGKSREQPSALGIETHSTASPKDMWYPISQRRSPRRTGRGRLAGEVVAASVKISERPFPRAASCHAPPYSFFSALLYLSAKPVRKFVGDPATGGVGRGGARGTPAGRSHCVFLVV
mmetsp:Transcript_22869/g.54682  ORF Transcript_22869/g.54682 Transcript_22869/m.54682 type:complete len:260 (-) Transcript_22869:321-1100(-)